MCIYLNFEPSLPTYFISSNALRARFSSSFIVSKSLTRAYLRGSLRTKNTMSSTCTRPVRPISIALQTRNNAIYTNSNGINAILNSSFFFLNLNNFSQRMFVCAYLCVVSVMNSITRSSSKSTLSVYGFWSSPYPYIIQRNSLLNSLLRPDVVEPSCGSTNSSSSNYN